MSKRIIHYKEDFYSLHLVPGKTYPEGWVDFEVYNIVLCGDDVEYIHEGDTTADPTHSTPAFKGFVKWDGCMEVHGDCPHFCGPKSFEAFNRLIKNLFKECSTIFKYCDYLHELDK